MTALAEPGRSIVRGLSPGATSTFAKLIESVGQLMIVVALAPAFGPRDYGTFVLALTGVTLLSSSLAVGGPALAARFLPSLPDERRGAAGRALAGRLGRWRALQTATVLGLGAVALVVTRGSAVLPGIAAVALVLDVAATLLFQIGLGFGRSSLFSFRFAVQNAVVVGGGLALYAAAGVTGAVAAIALASAATLAWGLLTVGRTLAVQAPAGHPHRHRHAQRRESVAVSPAIWRFGSHQAFGGIFVAVVHRAGIPATALLAGAGAQTGFAALAIGIAVAATYVVWQGFTVELPGLVRLAPRRAEAAALAFAGRALKLSASLAVAGAVLLEPGLRIVLGGAYRGATPALFIGLAVVPLAAPTGLLTQVAALRLSSRPLVACRAAGAVAFAIVCVAAIPRWGAAGAAAAVLAGTAVTLATAAGAIVVPGRWRLIAGAAAASALVLAIGAHP